MKKTAWIFTFLFFIGSASSVFAENSLKEQLENVRRLAVDAANYLSENGRDVLPEFNDPKGKWVKGDLYVFVFDTKGPEQGVVIAHPNSALIGKNFLRVKDKNGKYFVAEFLKIAKSEKGEGWSEYWWSRLQHGTPEPKISYIVKVPNRGILVGVGVYAGINIEKVYDLVEND